MSIESSHEPQQHWWISGEGTVLFSFRQPLDTCIYHYCWWCDFCGESWARLYFLNCVEQMPGSGKRWRLELRRCHKHGDGTLLDAAVISHLARFPIPPQIYERELRQEIMKHERTQTAC